MTYVCYNHHVNTLTSQMRVEQMLPIVDWIPRKQMITTAWHLSLKQVVKKSWINYCHSLQKKAFMVLIIDAKTAENAAGMTAMQTATDNAKKLSMIWLSV